MSEREKVREYIDPCPVISLSRMSNPNPVLHCDLSTSPWLLTRPAHPLQIFDMTSMSALRYKSMLLTGYLEYLIQHYYTRDPCRPDHPHVTILTPRDPQQRGCQLSLSFSVPIGRVFLELERRGVAVSDPITPRADQRGAEVAQEVERVD